LAKVANWISPIGILMILLPVGITICFWLLSKMGEINISSIVWHLISILASLTLLAASIVLGRHFIFLDNHRSPTIGQFIGNIILSVLVLTGIWFGIKRSPNKANAADGKKPPRLMPGIRQN
jgi:hypothetical protein